MPANLRKSQSIGTAQGKGRPNRSEQIHAANRDQQWIRWQEQDDAHDPQKENNPFNDRNTEETYLVCTPTIKIKHARAEGK